MSTNILILCTHNSARSILAEGMLNDWAKKFGKDVRAKAAAAGPGTNSSVHRRRRCAIVITVCDSAETCPYLPGSPVQVHWGYPDPSNAPEAEKAHAFESTRRSISNRMMQLLELPFDKMSDAELGRSLLYLAGA